MDTYEAAQINEHSPKPTEDEFTKTIDRLHTFVILELRLRRWGDHFRVG